MKKVSFVGALTLAFFTSFALPAQAESPIEPGYEVKFNLDLDSFSNQEDVVQTFNATHDEDVKVYYFDTPDQQFRDQGYIHRLRIYASDKKTNITYKKVFPGVTVENAIAEATAKGFHNDMSNYKFENDRKEGTDTFSISRKETFKQNKKLTFDSIDVDYAVKLFKDEAPKKYRTWNHEDWYQDTLSQTIPYGPALAETYEGEYLGIDADLEIWTYQGDRIAEISTKVAEKEHADQIEESWLDGLTEAGWLSDEQTSKTGFVMDK